MKNRYCVTCPVCGENLLALVTVDGSHVCLGRPDQEAAYAQSLPVSPRGHIAQIFDEIAPRFIPDPIYCIACGENMLQEDGCHCARFDRGLREVRQRQRELDEIYVSSQDLGFYPEGYVSWRLEFERTGIDWAYERMLESYEGAKSDNSWKDHRGYEDARQAISKDGINRVPKPRWSLYRCWWEDLPDNIAIPLFLFAVYLGVVAAAVGIMALGGCFNLHCCNSTNGGLT